MFSSPIPFNEAIDALKRKKLMPTTATAEELDALPDALKAEAFFSAKVHDARVLQEAKDAIEAIVHPEGRGSGNYMDLSTARDNIRKVLADIGYEAEEGKEGSIEDLSSDARLNLIVKTNVEMARGRGQWESTQDGDILYEFPCQELFRAEDRMVPRDWELRWRLAGGTFYEGRMIARKDDPIWTEISRFGTPWPPFDFNSGMDVEDVDRDEAVALGVIAEDDVIEPQVAPELAIASDIARLAGFLVKEVRAALGGKTEIADGMLTYKGAK